MEKSVSIITVCYNEQDVELTCKSVECQIYKNFEWIVVDGNSEQWCLDILKKYSHLMTHFVSEKDNGIYDAMNKGVNLAQGKYLLFLNAGDYLYDELVLDDVFRKQKLNYDIIYGKEKVNYIDGKSIVRGAKINFKSHFFWKHNYILRHQATFIKKELFSKFGFYELGYKSAADLELFVRFLYVNNATNIFVDQIIDVYKGYGGMSSENAQIGRREQMEILKKYDINPNKFISTLRLKKRSFVSKVKSKLNKCLMN